MEPSGTLKGKLYTARAILRIVQAAVGVVEMTEEIDWSFFPKNAHILVGVVFFPRPSAKGIPENDTQSAQSMINFRLQDSE